MLLGVTGCKRTAFKHASMSAGIVMPQDMMGAEASPLELGERAELRIPGPRLSDAIRQIEQMGEISFRQITGTDVTEEMLDLDIRLKNMEETRDRLVKLLDRAGNVEDLLAVEKELQRVTTELEVMKGRIKFLTHAVTYSTLTVRVNASVPLAELQDVIPFPWVRQLASDILLRPDVSYTPEQRFRHWLKMDLPPNCVKLRETKGYTLIMSGNGVMLLLRRVAMMQSQLDSSAKSMNISP